MFEYDLFATGDEERHGANTESIKKELDCARDLRKAARVRWHVKGTTNR